MMDERPDTPPTGGSPGNGQPAQEGTPSVPRRRTVSFVIPLSAGILLTGLWGIAWVTAWSFRHDEAREIERVYDPLLLAYRLDLQLRSAGVRRFVEKEGRFPESLTLSEHHAPGFQMWREWAKGQAGIAFPERWYIGELYSITESETLPPLPTLDLLGLPILYRHGQDCPVGTDWIRSTDPWEPEIEAFLRTKGGIPAAPPEPFAMTTPVYLDAVARIRSKESAAEAYSQAQKYGMLVLAMATALILFGWKGPRPTRRDAVYLVWAFSLVILAALLAPAIPAFANDRSSGPRTKTGFDFNRALRLQLLEEAVRHESIDPETARQSRDYIDHMPEER